MAAGAARPGKLHGDKATDPRLCAAIVDRLTFNAALIETRTESYRLAKTKARGRADAPGTSGRAAYPQTRKAAAADG